MENNEIQFTGVIDDPRSDFDKNKDYQHEELFGRGVYLWKEKAMEDWKSYPIRNQNGSGMCGAFSCAKALGINNKMETGQYVDLSPVYIYNQRLNNSSGMWMQNMFDIACNGGSPTDPDYKSDGITDDMAKAMGFTEDQKKEAMQYRGKNYVFITDRNIDNIASVVDQGMTPILLMRCNFKEWTNEPTVVDGITEQDYNVNHFIPVVDATLYKGKKCLIIEDSWGQQYGYKGRRILSEDFIKARVFYAGYIVDLPTADLNKPKHTFNRDLVFGTRGEEVIALQKCLVWEGLLKPEFVTGYFGNYTMKAVMDFQTKYKNEVLKPAGVKVATGKVMKYTRMQLNKLYS